MISKNEIPVGPNKKDSGNSTIGYPRKCKTYRKFLGFKIYRKLHAKLRKSKSYTLETEIEKAAYLVVQL